MNENTRMLIRHLVDGDATRAKSQAAIVLKNESTKKDAQFCTEMLRKLESKPNLIELPYNLQELLVAEDSALFPVDKYFLRESDKKVCPYKKNYFKKFVEDHGQYLSDTELQHIKEFISKEETICGEIFDIEAAIRQYKTFHNG